MKRDWGSGDSLQLQVRLEMFKEKLRRSIGDELFAVQTLWWLLFLQGIIRYAWETRLVIVRKRKVYARLNGSHFANFLSTGWICYDSARFKRFLSYTNRADDDDCTAVHLALNFHGWSVMLTRSVSQSSVTFLLFSGLERPSWYKESVAWMWNWFWDQSSI